MNNDSLIDRLTNAAKPLLVIPGNPKILELRDIVAIIRDHETQSREISVDGSRAEFEKIFGKFMEAGEDFFKVGAHGDYEYKTVYGAWLGWKAALLSRAPKPVSLAQCAEALRIHERDIGYDNEHDSKDAAKAVLDAAGVPYVD